LAALSFALQPDSAAVYVVGWLVMAALLYDEMKLRGLRRLGKLTADELMVMRGTLMMAWSSIRRANWDGSVLAISTVERWKTVMTFEDSDSAVVEGNLTAWGVPLRRKALGGSARFFGSFLVLVIVLFVVSQAILIAAAVLPFFPGEEQVYSSALNRLQGNVTDIPLLQQFEFIYSNNLQVATANMLPGLGALTLGAASYNTGRIVQVIGLNKQVPSLVVLFTLYLYPHSWVEELSYPITTAAGIMLLTRWRRISPEKFMHRANWGSVKFALALAGVAAQLTVAGFLEVVEPGLGGYALLLWVPVAAGVILVLTRKEWTKSRNARSVHPTA
jgi:uncharacterized membrane protein SpoIIM required for sporulation